MRNITKDSLKFLLSVNASIIAVEDFGIHSGVKIKLSNGMAGTGYQPDWKPLKLNIASFTIQE